MSDLQEKRKNLFLLMGQSNMAGRGKVDDVDLIVDDRITKTWFHRFIRAADPLFLDKWAAGVGPGMSFAKRIVEGYPESDIGLVTCAVGGTRLLDWAQGSFLYNRAVFMAEYALKFGEIKGILWHQGEGDAGGEESASTYCERFAKMIAAFRKRMKIENVPLVLGELPEFQNYDFRDTVNKQLYKAAKEIPHTGIVSAEGLGHIGDEVHIDAVSQRKFGKRYAEKYLDMISGCGIELI